MTKMLTLLILVLCLLTPALSVVAFCDGPDDWWAWRGYVDSSMEVEDYVQRWRRRGNELVPVPPESQDTPQLPAVEWKYRIVFVKDAMDFLKNADKVEVFCLGQPLVFGCKGYADKDGMRFYAENWDVKQVYIELANKMRCWVQCKTQGEDRHWGLVDEIK